MTKAPRLGVLHAGLDVADLEAAVAFYGLAGLEEVRRASIPGDSDHVFLGADGAEDLQLTVRHNEPLAAGTKSGHIAVAVESIADTVVRLGAAGFETEREPFRAREDGPLLCFVRDPDGYRLELVEA